LEMHSEESELRQFGDDLAGKHPALEPVADLGNDAFADELADRVADRALLVVEECVDGEIVEGIQSGRCCGWRGHEVNPRQRKDRVTDALALKRWVLQHLRFRSRSPC